MSSKLEENVRKLIERGQMSPNAMKKKKYKIDGSVKDDIRTSRTARKAANAQKIEMQHIKLKTNPDATGPKNCFIVDEETEWKDVTALYKK